MRDRTQNVTWRSYGNQTPEDSRRFRRSGAKTGSFRLDREPVPICVGAPGCGILGRPGYSGAGEAALLRVALMVAVPRAMAGWQKRIPTACRKRSSCEASVG